jgi:magnesium-protoporphyrin IX monomethyl ester (oxidative) cyclase
MRVLLIQPPVILNKNEIPQSGHPLGLAYIAAFLRKHGHTVEIFDSVIQEPYGHPLGERFHFGVGWDVISSKISSYNPDIVGISSMFTSQAECMHQVARLVKVVDPNLVTAVGGAHPSALPGETLRDENVDYVVIGEGENTMLKLVESLSNQLLPEEIDGIGFRKNGQIVINAKASFIENLDELPFPAWDMLQMKEYSKLRAGHGPFIMRTPFFSVITSRGCPGKCIFCSIHSIYGYRWRTRSVKNIVDEIDILKRVYGINQIDFEDDNLLLNRRRVEALCDEILERKLDISWSTPNGVAINHIDHSLLIKMKRAGCFSLSFGIESGNEHIRNNVILKPISVKHAQKVVKWCKELNIWTHGFFIFGLPGENKKTFRETINFAKWLDLDTSSFFIAAPYPGTELLTLCEERGYLGKDFDRSKLRIADASIKTESFSPEDLIVWRKRGYREFQRYFLKRELLHFNMVRRLLKIRSLDEVKLFYRLGIRFLKLWRTQ